MSIGKTTELSLVTAAQISAGAVGTAAISSGAATSGQVLQANGSGAVTFATPAASGVSTTGYSGHNFGATTNVATCPRWSTVINDTSTGAGWDSISLTRLIAPYNFTVSNIALVCTSRARGGTPTIRFGIYTRSGTTFTLVARTASDSTIFAATNTKYTRALNTTGGYPSTYNLTAGSEYWIGLIIYNASQYPYILANVSAASDAGRVATGTELYTVSSQTDLATSPTGVASTQLSGLYAEVS